MAASLNNADVKAPDQSSSGEEQLRSPSLGVRGHRVKDVNMVSAPHWLAMWLM